MKQTGSCNAVQAVLVAFGTVTLVALIGARTATAASTSPRFYDAIVVEAEGRSGAEPPPSPPPDAGTCTLPPEAGPCRGYFSSFYFDNAAGTCRRFTWSGCGGNANRFRTVRACEAACGHLSQQQNMEYMETHETQQIQALDDSDTDSVEAAGAEATGAESAERTTDCSTPRCSGGCFVVNDGSTDCPKCECSEEARRRLCSLPPSRGHCRALLTRWHYDAATRNCARFRFGGCDGNGNNFSSRDQCLQACAVPPRPSNSTELHNQQYASALSQSSFISRLRGYFSKLSSDLFGREKHTTNLSRRNETGIAE